MPGSKTPSQKPARRPLNDLESSLGYRFRDRGLLERALAHSSYANEKGTPGADSESLEFLGDAVLSLGVSMMLHEKLKGSPVGELARGRAFLVSEPNLARKARRLRLGEHLRLGRGEEKGGGRRKDSLLADACEAVLAAIYLDGGLEPASRLVERLFAGQIDHLGSGAGSGQDFKTDLQESLQAAGVPVPSYRVTGESGPAHRKSFRVELVIAGRVAARGSGSTKKAAEQKAARNALRRVGDLIRKLSPGSGGEGSRDHPGSAWPDPTAGRAG